MSVLRPQPRPHTGLSEANTNGDSEMLRADFEWTVEIETLRIRVPGAPQNCPS